MTARSRSRYDRQRVLAATVTVAVAGALIAQAAPGRPPGRAAQSAPPVNAQAAAMLEFQERLQAYLDLREALSATLGPLSPTADSSALAARQEALAAAMKRARARAKQGNLLPALVAEQIADTVAADRRRRQPAQRSATLREVPQLPSPAINGTYPPDAALPTVPALLLRNLPRLPDNLQYRFYGRHVVILDGDLQIITDYVSDVLPPN